MCAAENHRIAVVIPARLESVRLPRKLLLDETGKPLIQHTFESALNATLPEFVVVATDSQELAAVVTEFGGRAIMTSKQLRSGTDRVAQAALQLDGIDMIVNVQGDEPEIEPSVIDDLIRSLIAHGDAPMATMATPIHEQEILQSASCVKVVRDEFGNALYFSRAAIPFCRDTAGADLHQAEQPYLLHLGLYAYRRSFLLKLPSIPVSSYERIESLEQLRVLQAGYRIHVAITQRASQGIDTPEEYDAFVQRTRQLGQSGSSGGETG